MYFCWISCDHFCLKRLAPLTGGILSPSLSISLSAYYASSFVASFSHNPLFLFHSFYFFIFYSQYCYRIFPIGLLLNPIECYLESYRYILLIVFYILMRMHAIILSYLLQILLLLNKGQYSY